MTMAYFDIVDGGETSPMETNVLKNGRVASIAYNDIRSEIEHDIRYRDAEEIVEREGISCIKYMDEEN